MESALQVNVLVLNRLWQAVNVCTARRALCLLFQGHAQAVLTNGRDCQTVDFNGWRTLTPAEDANVEQIRTISFSMHVPRVIVLMFFDRLPRKDIKFTRHHIFERDKNQCQYCGRVLDRRHLNLDHVIPRDRGGATTWENIVCSCIHCNTHKGNRTPREAGMKLLRHPRRPKWRPLLTVTHTRQGHDSWRQFLDPSLWDVEMGGDLTS